jgi:aarF domain-containing kinase
MHEARGDAQMALIDFGLVAAIQQKDMDTMISAIIHLANKDYGSLVDDFISLEILPVNCDRAKVVPLMDKALTPYVKGGGAKKYEEELRNIYGMDGSMSGTAGGFQAMTQDALTVLNDIPFSIPPYFALLGRAIVTLEGVALSGDPNYGIIMEAYPFVARKLLNSERPAIQKALQAVLYNGGDEGGMSATRLAVLLNSALGVVVKNSGAFIDFDSVPQDAVDLGKSIKFLLSAKAKSLRSLLEDEAITAVDILLRQGIRKSFNQVTARASAFRLPLIGRFLPKLETTPAPFFLPPLPGSNMTTLTPVFAAPVTIIELAAPKLTREEELYALSLKDLATQTLGKDFATIVNGDTVVEPLALIRLILTITATSKLPPNLSMLSDASTTILKRLGANKVNAKNEYEYANLETTIQELAALTPEENEALQISFSRVSNQLVDNFSIRLQSLARR